MWRPFTFLLSLLLSDTRVPIVEVISDFIDSVQLKCPLGRW